VVRREGPPKWVVLATRNKGKVNRSLPHEWHDLVTGRGAARDWKALAADLRKERLDPLVPHLKAAGNLPRVRHLIVIPAGQMASVPIEALTGDYTISYAPSASVFARLMKQHRELRGSSLLALGAPNFKLPTVKPPEPPAHGVFLRYVSPNGNAGRAGLVSGDVLLYYGKQKLSSVADVKLSSEQTTIRFWRSGVEKTVEVAGGPLGVQPDRRPVSQAVKSWQEAEKQEELLAIQDLPGALLEVQALVRLLPSTLMTGSHASEEELERVRRAGRLKSYRLLHFATHGVVDVDLPMNTALLLARDRLPARSAHDWEHMLSGKKVYSDRLTVGNIVNDWELDADLVVLSACDTGLGKFAGGEGLLGFAQAFLQKGARSVVLSLWKVHDGATALLMRRFYQNLLGQGARKVAMKRAEALAEAKKWLRELPREEAERELKGLKKVSSRGSFEKVPPPIEEAKPSEKGKDLPFAHPKFWAAFVLIGDPD
jgi:hypothetical protein